MRRDHVQIDRTGVGGGLVEIMIPGGDLAGRVVRELVDAIEQLREDRSVRVVLLRSENGDFCTGPARDLDRLAVSPDPASAIAELRPPVVVAVSGECRSVGFELLLAADVRIAGADALFALDDLDRGELPCWGGTQRLGRAIRPAEATAMILLADEVDATRAASLGLVHRVCDDPVVVGRGLAEHLMSLGPLALELAKEAVHRGAEMPLRDGLRLEGDLNHLLASTGDRAEGLRSFFEKRPPDFAGR